MLGGVIVLRMLTTMAAKVGIVVEVEEMVDALKSIFGVWEGPTSFVKAEFP